jgi:replicative DNA helicase
MEEQSIYRKRNKNISSPVFTEYGKVPPSAIDLEEAVLGALMIESDSIKEVNEILTPEIFYKEHHQLIYSSIIKLFENYHPINILTVTNQLKSDGYLDIVGGPYYITQLTSRVASAASLEYWCRIIIQKWMQRECIRLSTEISNRAFDDSIDVFDTIDYCELQLKNIQDKYFESDQTPEELLKDCQKKIYKRVNNFEKGINNCVPTCVPSINKKVVGFERGEVTVIAARPSMGKTQLMIKCAEVASLNKHNPVIDSLEMSAEELVNRRICSEAGIDSVRFRSGNLSIDELKNIEIAIKKIKSIPVQIIRACSLSSIKSKCRQKVNKEGCEIFFIDYIQLIERAGKNDNSEIEKISRELKLLAQELDIPIVILSQLSRDCEKRGGFKIPMMSDLRDSGAIEQDADMIIFLYRPSVYGFSEFDYFGETFSNMDWSDMFAIIPKFRNGAVGHIHFKCTERMAGFKDCEEQWYGGREDANAGIKPNTNFYERTEKEEEPF